MRNTKIALVFGGFVVGAVAASLVFLLFQPRPTMPRQLRESDIASSSAYVYTDPLMWVSSSSENSPEYNALQNSIQSYITQQQANGLMSASVSFRDIYQSERFTINPDATYDPASLTKIPLMMAYYELAQNDPSILSEEISYSGNPDLDASEDIESPVQLTPGQSYTVEELIEHMIEHSDNNAEYLLGNNLIALGDTSTLETLFADLGIKNSSSTTDYATVQSYSTFLRVLYNATYLDRDYSEKALALLAHSDFALGLEAGVPSSVQIAEKFGEAKIPNASGQVVGAELHDCGIVYYPEHPYILCIMTKGTSFQELETAIQQISKLTYDVVSQRYQ